MRAKTTRRVSQGIDSMRALRQALTSLGEAAAALAPHHPDLLAEVEMVRARAEAVLRAMSPGAS